MKTTGDYVRLTKAPAPTAVQSVDLLRVTV